MLLLTKTHAQNFFEKVLSREWRDAFSRRKILKSFEHSFGFEWGEVPKSFLRKHSN